VIRRGPIFRGLGRFAGTVVLVAVMAVPGLAEPPDLSEVKKELEAIQRELQDIKALLREQLASPPRENVSAVLDVAGSPFKGAADARITLVEFSDYQCPFCGRHYRETLPKLDEAYIKTGKLRYVVRDFPLETIHPAAFKAAEAAHCARERGKYWEMHDRLFGNQRALDPSDLVGHAQALGLDGGDFSRCLDAAKHAARVRQDLDAGLRAGIRGTPVFFLGLTQPNEGKIKVLGIVRGAKPFASFQEIIEKLLASTK